MKKNEIQVGGHYVAKVSGQLVTVRVAPLLSQGTKIMRDKNEIITNILRNDVYMPESGVYRNLVKALGRMTTNNLQNLDLIITLARHDAVKLARQVDEVLI